MWEFSKLSKVEKAQYPDLITNEMLNWKHISIPDDEICSSEKKAQVLRSATMLGNKFAEGILRSQGVTVEEERKVERW